MANKEFKHKLSEAVERMSYDVLPEAKPEDFEVNVVAAVSEPFADARARNKAAKERFKKISKSINTNNNTCNRYSWRILHIFKSKFKS